jgi:hypothetical protein
VNFTVVAGPGGTGGGTADDAVALIHDVARQRKIRHPLVHLVQIGAEMPLCDRTRDVCPEQERTVRATAASLMVKVAADMAADGFRTETRPNGSTFRIGAGDRVQSLLVADQDNGFWQCSTVDGLVEVLVNSLFLRLFTRAGAHLAARIKDPDQLGASRRGKHE